MCGFISFFGPTSMQLYDAIRNKDFDNVILNLPHILTVLISVAKILNIYSNKTLFRKLFNSLEEDWKLLESKNELQMLDKFTKHGYKLACLYRRTLLIALVIFLSLPLYNPVLDIIIPLNETRQRNNVFQVHYGVLDNEEHFYIVSQIQKTAENNFVEKNGTNIRNIGYDAFKECVMMHYKCLQLYDVLEKCCRNLYLITMVLNAIILSVTAVEVIVFLDRPAEAIRAIVYLIAEQFHLYMFSLPGQTLLDQSVELANKIYDSDWYKIPTKAQKVFYLMQVRSNKPCILTAAGIYEMNIESFGITVKACMSYFTMFLSLRE
ncbi:uncharacterized protein LOC117156766 isoform X2 [Bombus vancouverensis nearcticus]|uniref:Uncharacterized protein LOC117212977 isoform X3 n=1 Tax=Bombus bifarius TaxID=103933 RepID=A0A6P8MJX8_9HYME|nr:uncharacterized protein LOC117156766 isoform X3 [Bombus vancouverensis nearcticus]XP_033314046.1 uncharacterized protein LOC117212977 isoform X3 [Bombus bifarius]